MKPSAGDLQMLYDLLGAAAEHARRLGETEAVLAIELTIELLPDPVRELEPEQPLAEVAST